MKVLVAYASRHGATAGIAERIALGLRDTGADAEARPVADVDSLEGYDAVVVGAAAYAFHWLKEARRFVDRHRDALRERPVWLFSSGPLGTEPVDEDANDVLEMTRPREFDRYRPVIHPRGERVFFGAWDPSAPAVGVVERAMKHLPAKASMPAGDFRDWDDIDAWSLEIAHELRTAAAG